MKTKLTSVLILGVCLVTGIALGVGIAFNWEKILSFATDSQVGQHSNETEDAHEGHGNSGEREKDLHEGEGQDAHGEPQKHNEQEISGAHEERGDEQIVRLTQAEIKEFGVELITAGPGTLYVYSELPGKIVLNADRLAHVSPRLSGIVNKVCKNLGDTVKSKEVMAVIESRELADAKTNYLAERERLILAEANHRREEALWKKKISSELDYLNAKQLAAEIHINLRSAEQKLHALGLSEEFVANLSNQPDASFTSYEILAPFDGSVIEKHIALGESLSNDSEIYIIADMSTVWVDISVYPKDLGTIQEGLKTIVHVGNGLPDVTGDISYIGPLVGEATRTALARVVLPNAEGKLRPGMFVTAKIAVDAVSASVIAPKSALQTIEDKMFVFVQTEEGFEPRPVQIGRGNDSEVDIVSGLNAGEQFVSKGSFTLKSQLSKGGFGDGHGH